MVERPEDQKSLRGGISQTWEEAIGPEWSTGTSISFIVLFAYRTTFSLHSPRHRNIASHMENKGNWQSGEDVLFSLHSSFFLSLNAFSFFAFTAFIMNACSILTFDLLQQKRLLDLTDVNGKGLILSEQLDFATKVVFGGNRVSRINDVIQI